MFIRCSTCGARVSKTWLFLGLPWSTYTCAQCGSVFSGTIVRFLMTSVAVGLLGYVLIRVLKGKMIPALLPLAIGLALVLLLVNLPGQIKKVGSVNRSTRAKPM